MLKKIIYFVLISLVLMVQIHPLHSGEEKPVPEEIIGMSQDVYRQYLLHHPPLDRIYSKEDILYFLVSPQGIVELESDGYLFSRKPLSESHHGMDQVRVSGDINGVYHNYREVNEVLHFLQIQYPDLARVFSVGRSVEGRELYVLKISDNVNVEENGNEPNVYIVGCHHAREWISVEVPLLFAQYLLANYNVNPDIRKAVDGAQIYIQPLLNPDGLEFSIHTFRYWRKNRRFNGGLSWGVDLNRNYGYNWGFDDEGSSPDPDSEVFRGTVPFSEPETEAVRNFLLANPPDGSLSFHNFSQKILYSWAYTDNIFTPHEFEMKNIAAEMARRMQDVNGTVYSYGSDIIYPVNGNTTDWIYGTFATPAFTIELPPEYSVFGGFFTGESMINQAFSENLPAMLYFVHYFVDRVGGIPWERNKPDQDNSSPSGGKSRVIILKR